MYYMENRDQLLIDEFSLPFGGKLRKDNRWVKMADLIPWEDIEEIYVRNMSQENGRYAYSARIAFGAIYIKEYGNLTDVETVNAIAENPYMQYFLGLKEFRDTPLFDSSMMVHFRKRFPVEDLAKINECICTGKWPEDMRNVDRNDLDDTESNDENSNDNDPPTTSDNASSHKGKRNKNTSKKKQKKQKKNRGKLLMDATVAPADIKYPTDIDLLNRSRELLETAINILWKHVPHNGHKLPYSAKKARKAYLALAKSKKWTNVSCRKAISEQLRYVELATAKLEKLN